MSDITHQEKIQWMAMWAAKNGLALQLESECGFGRECVGVSAGSSFPDYEWYDNNYDRIDNNGDVWTPPNAYHKHPCVAVLGRGEEAEAELYAWLKWFDKNGFELEQGIQPVDPSLGIIGIILGKHRYARMVKKAMSRITNNQTEYFNQLAEEFNAPDVEDKGDLPAVEAQPVAPVTPVIREPFTPLDSYGLRPTERSPHVVNGVHAQSDTAQNAPVLNVKQAW